jgi:hypothetical protein
MRKLKVKGTYVVVSANAMKAYRRSRVTLPLILNHDARWR